MSSFLSSLQIFFQSGCTSLFFLFLEVGGGLGLTFDPAASTSWVLELQVCTTIFGLAIAVSL
jgi:hypothetical protein